MIRIFLIGCVEFSQKCLEAILDLEDKIIITGVATKKSSSFNADFYDLSPSAISKNIPYIYAQDINSQESLNFIDICKPDIICCLGWSSLIKDELLCKYPIIGYHPSELPKNRGRHPLIWAMVLGLSQTASTYFLMDRGADSGNILSQEIVFIDFKDNARSMYDKLTSIAITQLKNLLLTISKLQQNQKIDTILQSIAKPQDHTQSNTWRKRCRDDGLIDFRMSSLAIYNLIRALSHPYPGAEIQYRNERFCVWDSCIQDYPHYNIESGKILNITPDGVLVKTYDGAILLTKHDLPKDLKIGEYL